jgi:DNA-binding transcriptional ArsR family regulator
MHNINFPKIKAAALVFRSVNHKLRQQILETINKNGNRMGVTDIYVSLRIEQSVASQHLAILRKQRVIEAERKAKQIFYSVNHKRLNEINNKAAELVG